MLLFAAAGTAAAGMYKCSVHKSEIDVRELRRLYRKVYTMHNMAGSPIKHSFFKHWQQLSGG
jgi:hypothetical protein